MSVKESDILRWLTNASTPSRIPVVEGVESQDDAAVLRIAPGFDICASTDFVRGSGFMLYKKGHLSLEDIGHYVVRANVSDLAAMGAIPVGYLSVVRYTSERSWEEVEQVLNGIQEACYQLSCPLIGGDTGTYEMDVLSGTAIGMVETGRGLARKRMTPGQTLFVTGDLGRPAAALALVANSVEDSMPQEFTEALEKWQRPAPRVDFGRLLVGLGIDVAAMDVSDGLAASLKQLSRICGVGFQIDESALPIRECVHAIAERTGQDILAISSGPSVDFELLFSAPPQYSDLIDSLASSIGLPISKIGETEGGGGLRIFRSDGSTVADFPGVAWDHQTTDIGSMFRVQQ